MRQKLMSPTQIKRLFEQRNKAENELRRIDALLGDANRQWSREHGYMMPLRIETFRQAING